MAVEDLGNKADDNEPQGGAEPTGAEPTDPKPDGADGGKGEPDDGVVDSHGQPGINKERHDKEVSDLKAEIAKLKSEAADASEAKAKREEYEKKIADLEAKMADTEVAHKLELAGCLSVKAAKALLGDFDGDVSKLKAECPYLFQAEKKKGSTGLDPKGPSTGLDDKIDAAMGVK